MLAIERRNAILLKLSAEGKVLVADLSREFEVTEETIRRDLEKLDRDGLARKTYGGAVKVENFNIDLPFHVRKQSNVDSKRKIASVIGGMINDGDYIMLDASTTALCIIPYIQNLNKLNIITNSIEILIELCNKPEWNIISTGGALKSGSLSLLGYQAEKTISGFHVDTAICSCKGLNTELNITDSDERESEIKKSYFKAANKKILAIDSSKFDKTSFVKVCSLDEIDVIVTDEYPGDEWANRIKDAGVELVCAK